MKVMISQPMKNRKKDDILAERKVIIEKFQNMHIDVLDTFYKDEIPEDYNVGVYFLGKSIQDMTKVNRLKYLLKKELLEDK